MSFDILKYDILKYAMINTITNSNLGRKVFIWLMGYNGHHQGKLKQEPRVRNWSRDRGDLLLTDLLSGTHSATILRQPRPTYLYVVPTTADSDSCIN